MRSLGWVLLLLVALTGCEAGPQTAPSESAPLTDVNSPDAGAPSADIIPAEDVSVPLDIAPATDEFADIATDTSPPAWPDGAALMASKIGAKEVTLTWPSALDDGWVGSYIVARDGLLKATLDASKTAWVMKGLAESTSYEFSVVAEDAAGNGSAPLVLVVQTLDVTPPVWGAAATVIATHIADTTVTLSWSSAADNVAVTGYEVRSGGEVITTTTGATTAELVGLKPWTDMSFHVVALDGAGHKTVGPMVEVKTTDTAAPTWPEGAALTSSDLTPGSVSLSWPAAMDNALVAGYAVHRDKSVVATTDGEITTAKIEGLDPASTHVFVVWAIDVAGNMSEGGPSTTVVTTDMDAPIWPDGASVIASNVMPNSLTLAWTPAGDDVEVTAYRVRQDGIVVATVGGTSAEMVGLEPWTDYSFTILAEDGAGNLSTSGPEMSLKTPDFVEPSWEDSAALVASDVTPHTLTLTWPGAGDDVSVVAYRVVQDEILLETLGPEVTTFDVTGLNPWTDYTFRVGADDQAGNVSVVDLEATAKTTDEVAPSWAAGELLATNVTPSALTLAWPAASDDVDVLSVLVTVDGEDFAVLDGDAEEVELTELTPWTDYLFGVTALDAAGNSSSTLELSMKTPDNSAPVWPNGGILEVSNLTGTSCTLSWPAAADDVGVVNYQVAQDGGVVTTESGDTLSVMVTGLSPMVTYLMTVNAVDYAGNVSASLNLTVTTPDGGPPTWDDAALTATAGISEVLLGWDPATDDVAVTGYRISQDGALLVEQAGAELVVSELEPDTEYVFSVEAGDAAGNWSEDGPSATVETAKAFDPGFRRLTQEQFTRSYADVLGPVWQKSCNLGNGPEGCSHPRDADAWYGRITEYSGWRDWRMAYPQDEHTAAPGEPRGGYRRLDQVVYNEHTVSWLSAVMKVANNDYEDWHGANTAFKACAYEGLDHVQCVDQFISDLGMRAFRRPLSDEEHAFFHSVYVDSEEEYKDVVFTHWSGLGWKARGVRNVMATIFLSPEFLYRVELGDENGNLKAYELASRLSYHFWNTMPDDALFAAAEDESLLTEEGYKAQVDRLADDPRAERAIEEFYEDFFRVQDIKNPWSQDGPIGKYHGGPDYNKYGNAVSGPLAPMEMELANLGTWFTATNPGTYEDMFRSNLHFLECNYPASASVADQCYGAGPWSQWSYGIPGCDGKDADGNYDCLGGGWDGVSPPLTFPEAERVGLLTRLAFLAHDTHTARPIRRGLNIREILLCDPIPPPENCDVVKPPVLTGMCDDPTKPDDDVSNLIAPCSDDQHCAAGETCADWDKELTMTVREVVEELTETPGTSCAGCHSTYINGFGHALGHFSSRGQYWGNEPLFKPQKKADGTFGYWHLLPEEEWAPIDTEGTSILNGQSVTVDGAHDLADTLVDSGQMEWCWSREYFRFAMGRIEWDVDEEIIENLAQTLRDGATLADAFKAIVYLPQFTTLYKPPKAQPAGAPP